MFAYHLTYSPVPGPVLIQVVQDQSDDEEEEEEIDQNT